ncbi:MAG TPA: hypothetical protein VMS55_26960 [Myxococcota bacterium]|nr:hypothetical protein [Myxococcota bacterium]
MAGASELSATHARDVRARIADVALLAPLLCGSAWLLVELTRFEFGLDQGIYAVVADAMLRGEAPYRDAWDFKPPGVYFVFALARGLLGPNMASVRILEAACLLSLLPAFVTLSRRFAGGALPGLLGFALAISGHVWLGSWHTAQPESFGGVLLVYALLLATGERRGARERDLAFAGSGALYALAALMKPPLGGGILVSAAFAVHAAWRDAPREARRRTGLRVLAAFAAGGAVPVLLVLAYFAAQGALPALADALFVFAPAYTSLNYQPGSLRIFPFRAFEFLLFRFSLLNPVGLALLFALPPLSPREREGRAHLLGVIFFAVVGVGLQGRFFVYHYAGALPLVALLAGWGLWKLTRVGRPYAIGTASVALLIVLLANANDRGNPLPGGFLTRVRTFDDGRARNEAVRKVASWVAAHTREGDRIYVWGFEPLVYDMAGRLPASHYIYNAAQRAPWSRARARDELMQELHAAPPAAVLVEHGDLHPGTAGTDVDSAAELEHFPRLTQFLADGYVPAVRIARFTVYLPRDAAAKLPTGPAPL